MYRERGGTFEIGTSNTQASDTRHCYRGDLMDSYSCFLDFLSRQGQPSSDWFDWSIKSSRERKPTCLDISKVDLEALVAPNKTACNVQRATVPRQNAIGLQFCTHFCYRAAESLMIFQLGSLRLTDWVQRRRLSGRKSNL
jgi:hypothetical protein